VEVEEEQVLAEGGQLWGSMVGRRRVLCTWAVGEAWERFSANQAHVVERAFTAVGLALPIDGSRDSEISIKGLETSLFMEGIKDWADGAMVAGGMVEEDADGEGNKIRLRSWRLRMMSLMESILLVIRIKKIVLFLDFICLMFRNLY